MGGGADGIAPHKCYVAGVLIVLLTIGKVSLQIREAVCLENEGLPVVLGHDVENDSCDDEQ